MNRLTNLKPIETRYNGLLFRSRIEARWALFYDTLGIQYYYEHEGFDLGDAGYYLPDFYFPKLQFYVEIKGDTFSDDVSGKCTALAACSGLIVYVFAGEIPNPMDPWADNQMDNGAAYFPDGSGDFGYKWCQCPQCKTFGIQFEARDGRLCDCVPGDKGYRDAFSSRLRSAYIAAREKRFEHGA